MKKVYIIITLFLFAYLTPVLAQTAEKKDEQNPGQKITPKEEQVYIGVAGNLNSSWIFYQDTYGEPLLNYQITLRPAFNIQVGYDWEYHWGFKAEIGYAMLGQKYKDTQYGKPTTRNIKLNYLQIPFLFKYRTIGEKAKFYIQLGPQLNILMSATQKYIRDGKTPPPYNNEFYGLIDVAKTEIIDRYTKVNCGLRLDLGVDVTLTSHLFLNIGLSTMYSMTNLKDQSWRFFLPTKDYHVSHSFYTGLNIGINYIF